jgi:hypothetical protein
MIWLCGIPITDQDARELIASLVADGGPDTTEAAQQIGRALAQAHPTVELTPAHRDAILSVIEHRLDGLTALRGALVRDQRHRAGGG